MSSNRTLVALLFALLLMVPSLGCTGYGALLHARVIEPPQLHISVGRAHLVTGISTPLPCAPRRICKRSGLVLPGPPTAYSVWVFVHGIDPYGAPHAILLLHLRFPLRP